MQFKDGDIKSSTTQIQHHDYLALFCDIMFLLQTILERCCCRFIDNPRHFQTSSLSCLLRGSFLRFIEVSGHRDHRVYLVFIVHFKVVLRHLLQLNEDVT